MFKFNYEKLVLQSDKDTITLYNALCRYAGVKSRFGSNTKKIEIPKGNSYIINLEGFLTYGNASIEELAEYIQLASYRNLADYVIYDNRTLSLHIALAVMGKVNTHNPLLRVFNNKIYFKFEEEEIKQWH